MMIDHRNIQQAVNLVVPSASRYEWADVILMPATPNVMPVAKAIEQALAELGVSCGYLRTLPPDVEHMLWGDTTDFRGWHKIILPVGKTTHALDYTFQMLRGTRAMRRYNLRGKFGLFVTFVDSGWAARLLTLACERQGIPTVFIQEGSTLHDKHVAGPRTLRALAGRVVRWARVMVAPELFRYVQAGMHMRYACVYGPLKAEALIARGKPRENVFVTGSPLFDAMTRKTIPAQPRFRTILYAHQILCDDIAAEAAWWRAIVQASQKVGAKLIFKMHPRATLSAAQICELAGIGHDTSVELRREGDIQDMVSEADALVTACSTSAYRALVEGVPVVILEGLPALERLDLVDHGAALPVYAPAELAGVFDQVLNNPQARLSLQRGVDVAIEQHLYRIDGQAARRVALALAGLLR